MGINEYDSELYENVQEFLEQGFLVRGSTAHGIAKQAIDSGYESLSEKQRAIFNRTVIAVLKQNVPTQPGWEA